MTSANGCRKLSKTIPRILFVLIILYLLICLTDCGIPGPGHPPHDDVIARVNGEDVPRDPYEQAVQRAVLALEQRSGRAHLKPELREYHIARGQGFEAIVDDILRAQAARKEGVQVSNNELRKTIDAQIQAEMDRMGEAATPQEKNAYEYQLRSIADPDEVRRSLLAQRLHARLRAKFKPTEADMMASYNEVKAHHILIRATPETQAKALQLANEVLAKVKAGGDFAALAKQYSDDAGSKNTGGDVGWITANSSFVPEFSAAARRLKKGEIAGPVVTMFGYHILKADDVHVKRPKGNQDPQKRRALLERFCDETIQNRTQTYLAALRMQPQIEPVDPWIAGYMAEPRGPHTLPSEYAKMAAEAIKHYEEAAKRPDLAVGPPLFFKMAELYNATHQDDKGLAALAKVEATHPSAELYLLKGEIYEHKKDKANAVKAYEAAIKFAEGQPWLYQELPQAFQRLGRSDLAQQVHTGWQEFNKNPNTKGLTPGWMPNLPFPVGGS